MYLVTVDTYVHTSYYSNHFFFGSFDFWLNSFSVTEYFKGNNWKVHPDWVYCEYNSASDKLFSSPEERVLHFLSRTRKPGWKWMSLRPRSPSSHHKQASKPDKDAYYCKCDIGRTRVRILDVSLKFRLVVDDVVYGTTTFRFRR